MKTLGFGVLAWLTEHLPSPADSSKPFVLTDEQARFVLDWYELDVDGRFVYRRGSLQGAKGIGKSPLGAGLAIAEFAGPVRFAGWDKHGEPTGRAWGTDGDPPAWVQLAAVSEDQAMSNTYALVWTMLAENDNKAAEKIGIDVGRTRLHLKASPGAKLEAVSSSWGAREGQRVTFGVMEESQNWTKQNGGVKLARTLGRNAAKMGGRTLELCNAHELGEQSVAESTMEAFETGASGILFSARRSSREPQPEMPDAELLELLGEVYDGSPWIPLDRILAEVRDPSPTWSEISRFYFNLPGAGTLAAVDPTVWASLTRERELEPGEFIGLGFDGSHVGDGTARRTATSSRSRSLSGHRTRMTGGWTGSA